MLKLRTYIPKIALVVIILAYFSFEVSAQRNNTLTSPFSECWQFETGKMSSLQIESDNNSTIYLSLLNGKIASVNLKTGKKNWESELGGEIILPPILDDKNIYIISKIKTTTMVRSISKDFGVTTWQVVFDFKNEIFFVNDNSKLVIFSKDGRFSAIDKSSGTVIWNKNIEQKLSSAPILFEHQIVLGTVSRKIFFYSIENGNILSQFEIPSSPVIVSIIKEGRLFWGDYKGNAYLINLVTKKVIWKIRSGGEITNILDVPKGFLISSLDNFIYFITTDNGKLVWKRRFDGRLSFSSIFLNKFVITVTFASETADIIDIKSGRLVNQFNIYGGNYFINKPVFSDHLFVFPTIRGLVAFADSGAKCLLN